MMIIRNILFYLGILLPTIFFSTLANLCFLFPFRYRYEVSALWARFFIYWAKLCCGLNYHIQGLENIPKQNAIVFSNHQSAWETVFMLSFMPEQSWVLKRELFLIPFFGWTLALLEPIGIKRKDLRSINDILQQGKNRLAKGRWVIIFPEGTRVPYGKERPFTRSGAALAKASGYPILPIAHNAGRFWPKGFFIKTPGTIEVKIGPLIYPEDKSIQEINAEAEAWINKQKSAQ